MPINCKICGKEYKRNITDAHLNGYSLSRDEYTNLTDEDIAALQEKFSVTSKEAPDPPETTSQTPSPSPPEEDEDDEEDCCDGVDECTEDCECDQCEQDEDDEEEDEEDEDEESDEPVESSDESSDEETEDEQEDQESTEDEKQEMDDEPGEELWQMNPRTVRNRRFFDRESRWNLNRSGYPGSQMPLPDTLTDGLKRAIAREIIVPVPKPVEVVEEPEDTSDEENVQKEE